MEKEPNCRQAVPWEEHCKPDQRRRRLCSACLEQAWQKDNAKQIASLKQILSSQNEEIVSSPCLLTYKATVVLSAGSLLSLFERVESKVYRERSLREWRVRPAGKDLCLRE